MLDLGLLFVGQFAILEKGLACNQNQNGGDEVQKVKLSIRLDVQQLYDLDRLAEEQGMKLSEVVRAAISAFLNAQKKQDM